MLRRRRNIIARKRNITAPQAQYHCAKRNITPLRRNYVRF